MQTDVLSSNDYWISPNALSITRNALGEANRIQASVASGAVVQCYKKGIIDFNVGHNPQSWPLQVYPTFFNDNEPKYAHIAIPRTPSVGTQAMVVWPSRILDIYGKDGTYIPSEGSEDEQIGSEDYYYVYLQGWLTAPENGKREWGHEIVTGILGTYEDVISPTDSEWYRYSTITEKVTFLKHIIMSDDSLFENLKAELADIMELRVSGNATFGDYFRSITGTAQDTGAKIFPDGTGDFTNLVFSQILKSKGASQGFFGGRGIFMDGEQGLIEADGMNVRGFMRVMELIINRLQLMESDYSFTEGDTITHIDYEQNGQVLVLTMDKEQENKYTPFYEGDIIYLKKNDLLPHGAAIPDGHTATSNGSYFTSWMWVESVDLQENKIRTRLYPGKKQNGDPYVPGGTNFSPYGTALPDTDVTAEMLAEYNTSTDTDNPSAPTLGEAGFDCRLAITRHGNIANSSDEHIHQSQLGRQQSWVLSTTDKRLSFFWNVDEPIVRDENYALCLGILPDLANLPTTRNRNMPSLYVNTVFADHYERANYPAKVVKEDRGTWKTTPTSTYSGRYSGTYTPDGTLDPSDPELRDYLPYVTAIPGYAGTYQPDDEISEPYHYRTFTKNAWLSHRLDTAHYRSLNDKQLMLKMLEEWRETVDLEISRVWTNGVLWECLVDGTTQEPTLGCTDWLLISGGTFSLGFYTDGDDPTPIMGLSVRPGNIDETVVPYLIWGQEDISNMVTAWRWERESQYEALDEAWANSAHTDPADPTSPLKSRTRKLHITTDDLPANWDANDGRAGFKCTAYFLMDGEEAEIINRISIV